MWSPSAPPLGPVSSIHHVWPSSTSPSLSRLARDHRAWCCRSQPPPRARPLAKDLGFCSRIPTRNRHRHMTMRSQRPFAAPAPCSSPTLAWPCYALTQPWPRSCPWPRHGRALPRACTCVLAGSSAMALLCSSLRLCFLRWLSHGHALPQPYAFVHACNQDVAVHGPSMVGTTMPVPTMALHGCAVPWLCPYPLLPPSVEDDEIIMSF